MAITTTSLDASVARIIETAHPLLAARYRRLSLALSTGGRTPRAWAAPFDPMSSGPVPVAMRVRLIPLRVSFISLRVSYISAASDVARI